MASAANHRRWWWAVALLLLLGGLAVVAMRWYAAGPAVQDTVAAEAPAGLARAGAADGEDEADAAEPPDPAPRTYLDIVRMADAAFADAQPLGMPVALDEAGIITLDWPVHLCSRGDLWITHPDGLPLEQLLPDAPAEQTHVTSDPVHCVHWLPEGRQWRPVVFTTRDQTALAVDGRETIELPRRRWHWGRALSWNRRLIVPADGGISVLDFGGDGVAEYHHDWGDLTAADAATRFLLDIRGVLAWAPWEDGRPGSRGAARFVDGQWKEPGAEQGWPERIDHLVPLLDGSVLIIARDEAGGSGLHMLALDSPHVDREQVLELVDQLSDLDPEKRDEAFEQLGRYGTGLWPILDEVMEAQPAEARFRLRELLRNRISPTIGGLSPVSSDLRIAARLSDGGVVIYSDAGVSRPLRSGQQREIITPAWISLRPGRAAQLLPAAMIRELTFGQVNISTYGNEWIVSDRVHGPRRFQGNHLAPLLPEAEREFGHFVGIDRRGRWLFRRSADAARTLLLDPTLPDPTPRLPVWVIHIDGGEVGWSDDGWPAIRRGGAWMLHETGWRPLDQEIERMLSEPPPPRGESEPLLIDDDGARYYDGKQTLRIVTADGGQSEWPLPDAARGEGPVHLFRAQGRLFLFNQPGRVLRIKPSPAAEEPFEVEAIFTRDIPNSFDGVHIWQDPAGRIVIAHEDNRLAVMFPGGRIPREIRLLIPARR